MTGTELQIIPPVHGDIAAVADRLPEVHTNATDDGELLVVWLKAHMDGPSHTVRAYSRIGRRFIQRSVREHLTIRCRRSAGTALERPSTAN